MKTLKCILFALGFGLLALVGVALAHPGPRVRVSFAHRPILTATAAASAIR